MRNPCPAPPCITRRTAGRQAGVSGNLVLVILTIVALLVAGWYALYRQQNADPTATPNYAADTPQQRQRRIDGLIRLVAAQPRAVQRAFSQVESLGYSSVVPALAARGALVGPRVGDALRHDFGGIVDVQGADTVLRLRINALPRDACMALLQRQPWQGVPGFTVTQTDIGLRRASGNPAGDCGERDNTILVQMKRLS